MNKAVVFVLVGVLVGCASTKTAPVRIDGSSPSGPVRIDGSSPKACEASWKKMEASLNAQQRQQLDLALLLIGSTKQHRLGTIASSPGISPDTIREEIGGKDFAEIIALAKATGSRITDIQGPAER
jgi:hypothetical protein